MSRVVTLTMNPAVDLSATTEAVLVGEKTRCSHQSRHPGGGGINVARGVQKLGGDALAVYPAGGGAGQYLDGLMDSEGVKHRTISTAEPTRENFSLHEMRADRHYHFVFTGPELRQSEWELCLDTLSELRPVPEQLVLSGSLPPGVPSDFYVRVSERFRNGNTQLILDTSGAPLRSALKSGHFHLVKPNQREFAQIFEISGERPRDYVPHMEKLIESKTVDNVVVTVGSEGAVLATRGGERLQLRPPPVKGESPVGAGDTFVALLAHALSEGRSMVDAVACGVTGAAAAVASPDTELYRPEDIDDLRARVQVSEIS